MISELEQIEELKKEGYFLTEFDLVNPTNSLVTLDLFNSNKLSVMPTSSSPLLPPSFVSSVISIPSYYQDNYVLLYNPNNNYLYTFYDQGIISILDCNTNLIIKTIFPYTYSGSVSSAVYNPLNNTIYTANSGSNNVTVVDCNTNTILTVIPLISNATGLAYNSINNSVYACSFVNSNVVIIDCSTNTVIGSSIPVGNTPYYIAYNSFNNYMYVSNSVSNDVSIIDCSTNTVIGLPIPVGITPDSLVYNPINNSIYISNSGSNTVSVIDCNTNTVTVNIPVGLNPTSICYDSLQNIVFVINFYDTNISTIDCYTNTVISITVPTGILLFSLVFNSFLNKMYSIEGTISINIYIYSSVSTPTMYITGSYNYNQFIQDIQDNPIMVKCALVCSSNQQNISQVFFSQVKNANGQIAVSPNYPQLSISVNQQQSSVSKVCFGDGFILDVESSFSGFTVQPNSIVKLILIQKQNKRSDLFGHENDTCAKLDMVKNNIQMVKGADAYNNIEFYSIKHNPKPNIRPTIPIKYESVSIKYITDKK